MSIAKTAKSSTDIHNNWKNSGKKRRRKGYYCSLERKSKTLKQVRIQNSVTGDYIEIVTEGEPVTLCTALPVCRLLGAVRTAEKALSLGKDPRLSQIGTSPRKRMLTATAHLTDVSAMASSQHVSQEESYTSRQRKKTIENLRKHQKTYEKKYGASDSQKREMSELYQEISRNWG